MVTLQTTKAYLLRNQGFIGTAVTVTSVGLSWLQITTSNKENVKGLDRKIETYHVENRTERIAAEQRTMTGAQDLKHFLQFGLSKEILTQVQNKKDGGKDDQKKE